MKINKLFFGLLCLTAVTLTSCYDEKGGDYTPAQASGGAFITADKTALTYLPTEEQEFTFKVVRVDSTAAETIGLSTTNPKFAVSDVNFAAGERTKDVTVKFDIATGTTETTSINVTSNAYLYGPTQLDFTITRFNQYGALIVSEFWEEQWEDVIYQIGDGQYLIQNCYMEGYDVTFSINFKTGEVTFPAQFVGYYNDNYGRIQLAAAKGTYDAETKTVTVTTDFKLPDSGYTFGSATEVFVFTDDPEA